MWSCSTTRGRCRLSCARLSASPVAGDYWFPPVRSLGGAIFILSAVLYPYVYLTARASFAQQSVCVLEVARTLGRSPLATFTDVALPLARPAIAAGVALVIMECLNDLGAVQYLGVDTLSASIFATWMQRSNLGGAAQMAAVMLALVVALFAIERAARGGARSHHTTGPLSRHPVPGDHRLERRARRRPRRPAIRTRLRHSGARHRAGRRDAHERSAHERFPAGCRQQPAACHHGGRGVRRRRHDARLRTPRRRHALRPLFGAHRRARLCRARHGPGHWPAHPARGIGQSRRRLHARDIRRLDRVAALRLAVRHHARLCDPLPRRCARTRRGRHGPHIAQPRCCGAHAR